MRRSALSCGFLVVCVAGAGGGAGNRHRMAHKRFRARSGGRGAAFCPTACAMSSCKNHTPGRRGIGPLQPSRWAPPMRRPAERGFSHFVEHMAFRGSKNFPDGELNHSLERLGLRFGAGHQCHHRPVRDHLHVQSAQGGRCEHRRGAGHHPRYRQQCQLRRQGGGDRGGGGDVGSRDAGRPVAPRRAWPNCSSSWAIHAPAPCRARETGIVAASRARRSAGASIAPITGPDRAILTVVGDVDPDALARLRSPADSRIGKREGPGGSGPGFLRCPSTRAGSARSMWKRKRPPELALAWVRPPHCPSG